MTQNRNLLHGHHRSGRPRHTISPSRQSLEAFRLHGEHLLVKRLILADGVACEVTFLGTFMKACRGCGVGGSCPDLAYFAETHNALPNMFVLAVRCLNDLSHGSQAPRWAAKQRWPGLVAWTRCNSSRPAPRTNGRKCETRRCAGIGKWCSPASMTSPPHQHIKTRSDDKRSAFRRHTSGPTECPYLGPHFQLISQCT